MTKRVEKESVILDELARAEGMTRYIGVSEADALEAGRDALMRLDELRQLGQRYLETNAAPPMTRLPDHPDGQIEAWRIAQLCASPSARVGGTNGR